MYFNNIKIRNIINEYIDLKKDIDEMQDALTEVKELSVSLKKSKLEFESELGDELENIVDERVKEEDLCPDCFHKTEYKIIHSATYEEPEESIVKCTNCEWYQ